MTTSGSSREQSDDEDAEVESGSIEQNATPGDIKRMRRYFCNLGTLSTPVFYGQAFNLNGVLLECCPTVSPQGAQGGESRHILAI